MTVVRSHLAAGSLISCCYQLPATVVGTWRVSSHALTFLAVIGEADRPRLAAGRKAAMIKGGDQSRVAESA